MSEDLTLYPLSNYVFDTKEAQHEEDSSVTARLQRLQNDFEQYGLRRTVEGLLLVHEHGHPHILLLQIANAFFKLPGDYLKPGEPDAAGLRARLDNRLGPSTRKASDTVEEKDWEVKFLLAQWWRPNYEQFMYPYVPAHITQPKEVKSMYLVQLPKHSGSERAGWDREGKPLTQDQALTEIFSVPNNMKIVALPLFELYDNAVRYGPLLAAVPHLLSRYRFELA